jgi:hypothetical protein
VGKVVIGGGSFSFFFSSSSSRSLTTCDGVGGVFLGVFHLFTWDGGGNGFLFSGAGA